MPRALRRHYDSVHKRRAREHIKRQTVTFGAPPKEPSDVRVGRRATTRSACSCWMCGHRRRWNGPKPSEIRRLDENDEGA